MGAPFAAERRLLAEDEIGQVVRSHYPELEGIPRDELVTLARWLRSQHGRLRDILRGRRRIHRGKADPRGSTTESAGERSLAEKKQVFARGLKRVNGRLGKIRAEEKRAKASAALRDALARREGADVHHPSAGSTARDGMRALPSNRRRGIVTGGRIGSVSQQGRNSQAGRDARG
ncbi:hypothetical protein [Roseococcus pinisoli]|uniref:Uncharacterized protein n=1 Tax=Roseococcus pinisoli TaxID=2835040 RepID=A0ABS5QD30_9PROT|nr:hypothetical protein [Roseococcus pinisoli]MBS7811605.1 hypothetical protein [Roseococcus pinisoli]